MLGGFSVIIITAIGALSGCAPSSSGSRHTLYDDIDGLAADSSSIVVGTVSEQTAVDDGAVSSVEVTNAPTNPQLGGNLAERGNSIAVGDTVEVRQVAAPFLEVGTEYLLFLTPSMLEGDAATQFYVTGADAGIYIRDGDEFRRVAVNSGDTLPSIISIAGNDAE